MPLTIQTCTRQATEERPLPCPRARPDQGAPPGLSCLALNRLAILVLLSCAVDTPPTGFHAASAACCRLCPRPHPRPSLPPLVLAGWPAVHVIPGVHAPSRCPRRSLHACVPVPPAPFHRGPAPAHVRAGPLHPPPRPRSCPPPGAGPLRPAVTAPRCVLLFMPVSLATLHGGDY